MDLRDRGGCVRGGVECGEAGGGCDAQLLDEDTVDQREADRRDLLLEMAELGDDLSGQQVGSGGQELAELDVDAAGLFEGGSQGAAGRGPLRLGGVPSPEPGQPGATGDRHDFRHSAAAGELSAESLDRVGKGLAGRFGKRRREEFEDARPGHHREQADADDQQQRRWPAIVRSVQRGQEDPGSGQAQPGDQYRPPPSEPDPEKAHPDHRDEYQDREKEGSHLRSLPRSGRPPGRWAGCLCSTRPGRTDVGGLVPAVRLCAGRLGTGRMHDLERRIAGGVWTLHDGGCDPRHLPVARGPRSLAVAAAARARRRSAPRLGRRPSRPVSAAWGFRDGRRCRTARGGGAGLRVRGRTMTMMGTMRPWRLLRAGTDSHMHDHRFLRRYVCCYPPGSAGSFGVLSAGGPVGGEPAPCRSAGSGRYAAALRLDFAADVAKHAWEFGAHAGGPTNPYTSPRRSRRCRLSTARTVPAVAVRETDCSHNEASLHRSASCACLA